MERELKNILIECNEVCGLFRMFQEVWNYERINFQLKYNVLQIQLYFVQGCFDIMEGRFREVLRFNDEVVKFFVDKMVYMYEVVKFKEVYGVVKKDVEFFKS